MFARVLAKRAYDRYRTCGEFSDALREALGLGRYQSGPQPNHPPTELAVVGPGFEQHQTFPTPPPFSAPPPFPAQSPYPAPLPPPSGWDASRPDRRPGTRWPAVIAATAIVVAAVVIAAVIFATRTNPSSSASGTTTPPVTTGHKTNGNNTGGHNTGGQRTTPPSWTPYQDPGLFTIDLPPGWTVFSSGSDEVKFAGSPPGFIVAVAWTRSPEPDAAADWRQQSAMKAATDSSYHLISIRHVSYRGYNAADWQFTDAYPATLNQFLDRGFIVHPGTLAFAIELYGPPAQFQSVYASIWRKLVTSFEPAS